MSGNRGAKGSIKDRLISMLYRYRYNQKRLKEEDYTKEKKEKQKEYLDTLKSFEEKEDINKLDTSDVEKLDDVKLEIGINPNNELDGQVRGVRIVKQFDNVKLEINGNQKSAIKNKDLKDDKLNIKKETKKVKEEITILKEVNKFVEKSKESLNEIEKSVIQIKEELKEKNQDISEIEEKYKSLKSQIEKLKLQYDTIKNKYDLSELKILGSIKLMDSASNYKTLASLNEIEMMVKVCQKEFNNISSVNVVNKGKKQVGDEIKNIKEDQKETKIKFDTSKDKINELKNIEKLINEELNNQINIVNEMYSKASYIEEEITRKFEYVEKRKILSSIFRISAGVFTVPLTGKNLFGIALGTTLINKGLRELNKNIEKREKISINVKYEDLTHKISDVKDLVNYTNLTLTDTLYQVEKLKENFKNEYSKYSNVLPNYVETVNKLDNLQVTLKGFQERLLETNKKIESAKELNSKKLSKVYELQKKN